MARKIKFLFLQQTSHPRASIEGTSIVVHSQISVALLKVPKYVFDKKSQSRYHYHNLLVFSNLISRQDNEAALTT